MDGLRPDHPRLFLREGSKTWMPGSSSAKTRFALWPGHDDFTQVSTPTIAPIRHVVSVPDTIDFSPSALISSRRCGAMVPRPPIMMPRLPKLAKTHLPQSIITPQQESRAPAASHDS